MNKKFILFFVIFGCFISNKAESKDFSTNSAQFNKIVDAIGRIENSEKYPYGIKSVQTNGNKEVARRICYNTVRNNYIRWEKSNKSISYLEFLQRRYCPIGAPDDPRNLNSNWLKNLKSKLGKDFKI